MKTSRLWPLAPILGLLVLILALSLGPAAGQHQPVSEPGKTRDEGQASGLSGDRVVRDLEQAIARVQPLLDRYGYPALFLAILVEGFGLVAPGQTILIAAALTAAQGGLNIVWVLVLALTAAVLGNTLGYLLGRWGGRPLLQKFKVNERHLQRMEGYFRRYGKGVVFFGRFFDGLRQLNGVVAGMLKMPWQVFMTCNILGAGLWTGVWGLGAYGLEKKIASWHLTFRSLAPWLAAFFVVLFLALLVYLLHQGRKKG